MRVQTIDLRRSKQPDKPRFSPAAFQVAAPSWFPFVRRQDDSAQSLPEPILKRLSPALFTAPWKPWTRKVSAEPVIVPLEEYRRLGIAAFLESQPTFEGWFPMRGDRLLALRMGPDIMLVEVRPRQFSIATIVFTPGRKPPPLLVQVDPTASQRMRTHEQLVANIFNSLIRQGTLLRHDDLEWHYGYNPNNLAHWALSPPATLEEALDRLAAAVVAITNGTL